jgi:DNA-directed RNA polymerase specialized sigma24 family protein
VQPAALVSDEVLEELLAVDALLSRMEAEDPGRARIVECRVFGGMSLDEIADALGLAPAIVRREWRIASAHLYRQLQSRTPEP